MDFKIITSLLVLLKCHLRFSDLSELLCAYLAVPVPVEEGEGLLQALHLLDADVSVRAGLVCHGDRVTITGDPRDASPPPLENKRKVQF